MPSSGYFDTVFAVSGTVTPIPDPVQGDGTVSYNQGYGVLYSTPVASGGLNFPRAQFNQLMNDVTGAIQFIQQNGASNFITSAMNGGSPYSYKLGATVMYDAGSGLQKWISVVANNVTIPGANADWQPEGAGVGVVFTGGTSTGSANAQAVATTQGNFTNTSGNIITWIAGFSNTGASTLTPDGGSAIPLKKASPTGAAALANGDIIVGLQYMGISDGTNIQVLNLANTRIRLGANTTYFYSNAGNDTTGNGSTGSPWATSQFAYNYVVNTIDAAGFSVKFQFQGSGPYTANTTCSVAPVPANTPITFDGASQVISTSSADCFTFLGAGITATVQNMTLQTAISGNGLTFANGAHLNVGAGINFGAVANQQISGTLNGIGQYTGTTATISGGATSHIALDLGARFFENGVTKTLTGTPAFSNDFVSVQDGAGLTSTSMTYSGAATGAQYIVQINGVINTGGAPTNWPTGLTAGSNPTGGRIN